MSMFDQFTDGARGEDSCEDHGEDHVHTQDIALYRKVLNSDLHHDMIFQGEDDGEGDDSEAPINQAHIFKKSGGKP
jgi:hypothetical protein